MEHQTPGDLWAIQHGNRKRRSFLAAILGDVGFRIGDLEFELLGFGLGSEALPGLELTAFGEWSSGLRMSFAFCLTQ